MPASKYIASYWYAVADFFAASVAWASFYFIRKAILHQTFNVDPKFFAGIICIPLGWLILYGLVGTYHSVYKKSRLAEITSALVCAIIGCTVLFFVFLLDDTNNDYSYYYQSFFFSFSLPVLFHFACPINDIE